MSGITALLLSLATSVRINDHTVGSLGAGTAQATITLTSGGDLQLVGSESDTPAAYEWNAIQTAGIGAAYWTRLTVNSGDNPTTGTTATWLQLSSNRAWDWSLGAPGGLSIDVTVEISTDSGGAVIVDSADYAGTVTAL